MWLYGRVGYQDADVVFCTQQVLQAGRSCCLLVAVGRHQVVMKSVLLFSLDIDCTVQSDSQRTYIGLYRRCLLFNPSTSSSEAASQSPQADRYHPHSLHHPDHRTPKHVRPATVHRTRCSSSPSRADSKPLRHCCCC